MEKYLKNIEAWCWRYKGNSSNYRGLHFTARPEACDALIKCIGQLRKDGCGARRTAPLRMLRAEDEAKVTGGKKYRCFSRLRISLHDESDYLRQMSFRAEGDIVYFDFTESDLWEFEHGLYDVLNGTGDYCIGPEVDRKSARPIGELDRQSEDLWFWPCFGHLWVDE